MATTTTTTTVSSPDVRVAPGVRPWLGWFALAVVLGMQAGTVFGPLGSAGETRVADWVDLLTPYAVLGTAAVVLARVRATQPQWVLFGIGGVSFALGKGMHLAANSVSNVADPVVSGSSIVHLWDEVVSHLVWYSGLFLVLLALAWALRGVTFRVGALDLVVAGLVAVTLVNNYIEGAQPVLGLVFLATLLAFGPALAPGARVAPAPRRRRARPPAARRLGCLLVRHRRVGLPGVQRAGLDLSTDEWARPAGDGGPLVHRVLLVLLVPDPGLPRLRRVPHGVLGAHLAPDAEPHEHEADGHREPPLVGVRLVRPEAAVRLAQRLRPRGSATRPGATPTRGGRSPAGRPTAQLAAPPPAR